MITLNVVITFGIGHPCRIDVRKKFVSCLSNVNSAHFSHKRWNNLKEKKREKGKLKSMVLAVLTAEIKADGASAC